MFNEKTEEFEIKEEEEKLETKQSLNLNFAYKIQNFQDISNNNSPRSLTTSNTSSSNNSPRTIYSTYSSSQNTPREFVSHNYVPSILNSNSLSNSPRGIINSSNSSSSNNLNLLSPRKRGFEEIETLNNHKSQKIFDFSSNEGEDDLLLPEIDFDKINFEKVEKKNQKKFLPSISSLNLFSIKKN
jgi:hypothetical protein